MIKEGLIVFNSTHDSIKADDTAAKKNLGASLIPTHPSISVGCGFMLKIAWEDFDSLVRMLKEENIPYKALYYSEKEGIKRSVTELKDYKIEQ